METPSKYPMDVAADVAAAAVKRQAPVIKDGKATGETKEVPVKAGEVLSCRVRGGEIVVVTTDGQKLTGPAPKVKVEAKP